MKKILILIIIFIIGILCICWTGSVWGAMSLWPDDMNENLMCKSNIESFNIGREADKVSLSIRPMTEAEKQVIDNDSYQLVPKISISVSPMTANEKKLFLKVQKTGLSSSSSVWSGMVNVPRTNKEGKNGLQLGYNFIATPNDTLVIETGEFPKSISGINISAEYLNGMDGCWVGEVHEYEKIIVSLGEYGNYQVEIKVSTVEQSANEIFFNIYGTRKQ